MTQTNSTQILQMRITFIDKVVPRHSANGRPVWRVQSYTSDRYYVVPDANVNALFAAQGFDFEKIAYDKPQAAHVIIWQRHLGERMLEVTEIESAKEYYARLYPMDKQSKPVEFDLSKPIEAFVRIEALNKAEDMEIAVKVPGGACEMQVGIQGVAFDIAEKEFKSIYKAMYLIHAEQKETETQQAWTPPQCPTRQSPSAKLHSTHWIKDDSKRKNFWQNANNIAKSAGIEAKNANDWIHKMLDVTSMEEYPKDASEALRELASVRTTPAPSKQETIDALKFAVKAKLTTAYGVMEGTELHRRFVEATGYNSAAEAIEAIGSEATLARVDAYVLANPPRSANAQDEAFAEIVGDEPPAEQMQSALPQGQGETITRPNGKSHAQNETPRKTANLPQSSMAIVPTGDTKWDVMRQQADVMIKSGFLPKAISTPEKAIAIAMMGEALGLLPIVAWSTLNVIGGKPTIPPQIMLALIDKSGLMEQLKIEDDGETCTVTMTRKGRIAHIETFSVADSQAMRTAEWTNGVRKDIPLSEKDNWKQQPRTMRKWRAISAACRVVFPDVIWGFYTPEELDPDTRVEIEVA